MQHKKALLSFGELRQTSKYIFLCQNTSMMFGMKREKIIPEHDILLIRIFISMIYFFLEE